MTNAIYRGRLLGNGLECNDVVSLLKRFVLRKVTLGTAKNHDSTVSSRRDGLHYNLAMAPER